MLPDQADVTVGCDNYHGGYAITQHLLERGAKRIAFLGDASIHSPEFLERHRGYQVAIEAAGLRVDVKLQVKAISSEQSGFAAANELLKRKVRFDAICAASDLIATGAMQALQARGKRLPADIPDPGLHEIPLAGIGHPS